MLKVCHGGKGERKERVWSREGRESGSGSGGGEGMGEGQAGKLGLGVQTLLLCVHFKHCRKLRLLNENTLGYIL